MSRGIGEIGVVHGFPEWTTGVFGLVTQLGDMWFVVVAIGVVVALGYHDRSITPTPWRDGSYLLALAIGAYALTIVFKYIFEFPRPPGATTAVPPAWLPSFGAGLYEWFVTADGFGFPSGHALKSVAVYGGGALVFDGWSTPRRRWLGVAAIVLAVALSRVVLGVHYVVDVVVGLCLGAVFLWGMWTVVGINPRKAFAVTGLLGLLAVAVSMELQSVLVVVGSGVGVGVWTYWSPER